MNYYHFSPNDQIRNNWLLYEEFRTEPCVRVRERYREIVCPRCGKSDHDEAFDLGFETNIRIRARGDIICTSDDFYCITEKLQSLLEARGVQGVASVRLGNTGWYVMNVVLRVNADQNVYELSGALCRVCERPSSLTGLFGYLSQIQAPRESRSVCTPVFGRRGCAARDIFAAEDVVRLLKENGIKGGRFERLLTAEEEARVKESVAQGKSWWPARSKTTICL